MAFKKPTPLSIFWHGDQRSGPSGRLETRIDPMLNLYVVDERTLFRAVRTTVYTESFKRRSYAYRT